MPCDEGNDSEDYKKNPDDLFIGSKLTPFGREIASLSLRPLKIAHKKTLTFIVRAEVEKIGLTSTSFGMNFSPDAYKNSKSPMRGFLDVEKIGLEPTTS
ncbi:MAG: hypothetical protein EB023_15205 [Flavobacteriia bacterium]|nr:hypothetical protein [Flavobacteriia bacterium]